AIAYSIEKTFNVNLDDGNGNIIRQIVSEGAKFIPPADLTKDGYDFDGWYKDDTFTQKWNPDTDKVTSDIKLYAKWIKRAEPTKVDVPDTKVDVPDTKVDVPDTKVDVPDTKVDVPETKVDTPETKTDKPAEITVPDNTAKSPTTGDMTHTGVVFILMMLSALGVVCLRFIRKKI
ncbi:MAG: InlB B-repeat-containing protein, partial [Lachnospiraceae bacterium]|nr:InlB B-repeat-containing protein [Lachnospiraceae bacterium]